GWTRERPQHGSCLEVDRIQSPTRQHRRGLHRFAAHVDDAVLHLGGGSCARMPLHVEHASSDSGRGRVLAVLTWYLPCAPAGCLVERDHRNGRDTHQYRPGINETCKADRTLAAFNRRAYFDWRPEVAARRQVDPVEGLPADREVVVAGRDGLLDAHVRRG